MQHPLGTVIWITGLPGSGKTTLSRALQEHLRDERERQVVLLDGDSMRHALGRTSDYSLPARQELAHTYSRLAHLIALQGFDVICATVSLFHTVHDFNRQLHPHYLEVYLKMPMALLIERDQKKLYSQGLNGQQSDVLGVDIQIEEPQAPHLTLASVFDINQTAKQIADLLNKTKSG